MPFHRPIPNDKQESNASAGFKALIEAEKLMQIALVLPCAAFVGWLGGAWLDTKLHQGWIAVFGIVFGGIAGIIYVVRLAFATMAAEDKAMAQAEKETKESDSEML